MKSDDIELLLQKYYEGTSTVNEENQLKDFFAETDPLPDHLKPHAAVFLHYVRKKEDLLDTDVEDDWLFEKIGHLNNQKGRHFFFLLKPVAIYWKVAASIVLMIGVFWAGYKYEQQSDLAKQTEMASLRQEIREMRQLLLGSTSASERISLVNREFNSGNVDEMIEVLEHTMNTDVNVNVRLAACEALFRFNNHPEVSRAFVRSLTEQTDPLMQITLIEMLVALNEKSAVGHLEKLVQQENILPIVKHKAEEGIGVLI